MKGFVVIIILIGGLSKLSAQYKLSGVASDGSNRIDVVQVLIQDEESIIAHSFTDSTGYYELEFSSVNDSIYFIASRLGYQQIKQRLPVNQKIFNLALSTSADSKLDEIVITAGKAVETSGDTVSYFTQSFADGTERVVEDILMKLPGITVDEGTGTIRYQGKEIKKVLLDGDDLTGENYKVISKNLSAAWLEQVEVLKRFTESRLLQGIQQSDEVALNLKLKEDAKARLFGSATAAGGTEGRYLGKVELLSYLKKVKVFSSAEVNNTGVDIESYDLEQYASRMQLYNGFITPNAVLANELDVPNFFARERFTFHEGQFLSGSLVANLSPKSKLRSTTTLYNNRLRFVFTDTLTYFLPGNVDLSIQQRQEQEQRPFEFFQELKFENQITRNQDINLKLLFIPQRSFVVSENQLLLNNLSDSSQTHGNTVMTGITYQNRFRTNWVGSINAEASNRRLDEHLSLQGINSPVDSIIQNVQQGFNNIGIFPRLDGVVAGHWYFNILSGWSQTSADIQYARKKVTDNLTVDDLYRFNNAFAEFKVERKLNNFSLTLGSRIRNADIRYNGVGSNRFYIEPTLMASTKLERRDLTTEIRMLFNSEYRFLKPNQLVLNSLLSNYRSAVFYHADASKPVQNTIGAVALKITDGRISFLSANAEWVYLRSSAILVQALFFQGDAVVNNQTQGGVSQNFLSRYALDRYFSRIRTSLKVAYDYNLSISPLSIEGNLGESRLKQSKLDITSGTALTSVFNLSLGVRLNNLRNEWEGDKSQFLFQNFLVKWTFKPTKAIRASFDYQSVNFNRGGGYTDIFNTSLQYSIPNDRMQVELAALNITNRSASVLSAIDPLIQSTSIYPLQPRFFLLSVLLQF